MSAALIVGQSSEAINAAIWLASQDKPARILAQKAAIDRVLDHHKFDRYMTTLWEMYRQTGRIAVVDAPTKTPYVWFFLEADAPVDAQRDRLLALTNAQTRLILSGSMPIGAVADLAKSLPCDGVCYAPFVFIKDGAGFLSMAAPDLAIVGEKKPDVHKDNALILALLAHSKKRFVGDIKTVEFARSAIMAMLATRLSFVNEMARLADAIGVDMTKAQKAMGLDGRIGDAYLQAGWGFGGHTLPSETALLDRAFESHQVQSRLLRTVLQINDDQKELIFRKFWRYFDGFIERKKVAIWGAGYRAGTGRTTNSAAHPLLKLLWSYRIQTDVYAPNAGFELLQMYGDEPLFALTSDPYALEGVDAVFVINWSDPSGFDVDKINRFAPPIFDGKNLFDDAAIARLRSDYCGVGKNRVRRKKDA